MSADLKWMTLDRDAHQLVATRAMDRADRAEKAIREAVAILTGQVMSISRRDEAVIVLNTALNASASAKGDVA